MTISNGVYAADGSIRTTTVPGTSWTGLYAADGSFNIVLDSVGVGLYHACGAWRVSTASNLNHGTYDPSGAYYYNTLLGNAGSASFVTTPPPVGSHWEFVTDATNGNASVTDLTNNNQPVVALVGN